MMAFSTAVSRWQSNSDHNGTMPAVRDVLRMFMMDSKISQVSDPAELINSLD